ncbi:MAG TPA: hypothetical protein VGQ64_01095, partial [Candidatus Limnocylindrales bacterium]|nr:hypothetical protein [Candidatus Limnocylindrales bacterium]
GLLGSGPSLRPFASALTTLGIAGLLLTVGLPGIVGGLGSAAGGAAPAQRESTSLSQPSPAAAPGAEVVGSGKSNDLASPPADGVSVPVGPAASSVTVQGAVGSPANAYYGADQSTGTDRLRSATPSPTAQPSTISIVGVLAAVSLGVFLLGLVLLIRSRARPFDSAG